MFWNKKEDKNRGGLPELPPMRDSPPNMSDLTQSMRKRDDFMRFPVSDNRPITEEIHSLPSFPDSPMKRGFSQSAIKDAVETDDVSDNLPELPELADFPAPRAKIIEMEERPVMRKMESGSRRVVNENKPVFIRIDKFQAAKESLETVKEKINEIDTLLRTIREVKMKEDQEISAWEKEIESVKARLSNVTEEIFENPSP